MRLADDARKATLDSATAEVHRLGDRRIGTQHLLLALLHDPGSLASRLLGIDLAAARATLTEMDRAALSAIGVDAAALDRPRPPITSRRRPAFTSGARNVLKRAVEQARSDGASHIEEKHLLQAILNLEPPDAAADLLAAMRIDTDDALRRLGQAEG